MAYSDKINHKRIKRFRLRRRVLPIAITVGSTGVLTAIVGASGRLNSPRSFALLAIFAALMFVATGAKRLFDRTFDGVVTDKKLRRVTKVEGKRALDADRYMLFVTDGNGKVHETAIVESVEDSEHSNAGEVFSRPADAIEYFRRGDRVRHHAGMQMYEKEDKSKDRNVLCCGCLTLNDIALEQCRSCGLPLLK
ncbi:MAG: hypothetical protein IKB34_03400 [Clostridia bacterium]|nr:hypothetical protein [Clostridia bacterium]